MVVGLLSKESDSAHSSTEVQLPRPCGVPLPGESSVHRLASTLHPVEGPPSRLAGTPHPGVGLFPLAAGSLFLAFRYILQSILSLQKGPSGGSSLCPVPNF
jgi:hypothetical protein